MLWLRPGLPEHGILVDVRERCALRIHHTLKTINTDIPMNAASMQFINPIIVQINRMNNLIH